jgi:hypothetical protein
MTGNMRSVVGDSEAPMMGGKKRRSVSYKKGGMGGNMRSAVGDSSSSMMGGKKRRSVSYKKGGMGGNMRSAVGHSAVHMMGGKTRRSKKSKSRRAKKGGMGAGFGAILQEAIVPFGIFAWQKRSQRRR